jgi:4-diphosphocytidyl-2-C-methyl-D-erythritol kinase
MSGTAVPARGLPPVVRLAPAKVNLTLAVLGARPDGYHELHSVMVPLDLADRLSVSPTTPGGRDTLHVEGYDPGPVADNLVLRAFGSARQAVRATQPAGPHAIDLPPLAARLEKRIPIAAGLAGGSSDAAAAADAALEAWGVELGPEARARLAASIGSDVPFFLAGGPALVEGRGERIGPLPWLRDAGDRHDRPGLLLVTPGTGIATPQAFALYDAGARPEGAAVRLASAHLAEELRRGLRVADLLARASVLAAANDLAPAAAIVEPGLVPFRRALVRLLARPVGLSGSGPTHWALYASHAEAEGAAVRVRDAIAAGDLPVPGTSVPFVAATRILGRTAPADLESQPHQQRREP